jgi:hypothetical protein
MNTEQLEEDLLCASISLLMAVAILAIVCGDGDKGLLSLFY